MKKKLRFATFLILLLTLFLTFSCSMFDENRTGRVSFVVDDALVSMVGTSSVYKSTGAQRVLAEDFSKQNPDVTNTKNVFIDFIISGGYSASKTVTLETGEQVVFEDIPVGISITCSCIIYRENADDNSRTNLYEGSRSLTVKAGSNEVNILLSRINAVNGSNGSSDGNGSGISGGSVPEGFVRVTGDTFDGTTTLSPTSSVFISGRIITIGDLLVCDHEVTQAEYETYCKYNSDSPNETYGKGNNYPAYYVNWYDAIVYCNLRSIDEGLNPVYKLGDETDPKNWSGIVGDAETGYCGPSEKTSSWDYNGESDSDGGIIMDATANGYRLPTEAEWEYIARGGSNWESYKYSGSDKIDDVAWNSGNTD